MVLPIALAAGDAGTPIEDLKTGRLSEEKLQDIVRTAQVFITRQPVVTVAPMHAGGWGGGGGGGGGGPPDDSQWAPHEAAMVAAVFRQFNEDKQAAEQRTGGRVSLSPNVTAVLEMLGEFPPLWNPDMERLTDATAQKASMRLMAVGMHLPNPRDVGKWAIQILAAEAIRMRTLTP